MNLPKHAAIYVRVSTRAQAESGTSPVTQLNECRHAAEIAGYTVLPEHVFNDSMTGSTLDRPALTGIRKLVQRGEVAAVYFYHLDRLGRDAADILTLIREFRQAGAAIATPAGILEDTPEGKVLTAVFAAFAETERSRIAERAQRGKRHRTLVEGNIHARGGGTRLTPYGYMPQGTTYAPDPATARHVREIYRLYVEENWTFRRIAAHFNETGIPSMRGGLWHTGTISAIVRNPVYTGKLRVYDTYVAIPAIISDQLYRAAQERAAQHRALAFRHARSPNFLLRGLVYCTECTGKPQRDFDGHVRYAAYIWNGGREYRYVCSRRTIDRAISTLPRCAAKSLNGHTLDRSVWQTVVTFLSDPAGILAELEEQPVKNAAPEQLAALYEEIDNLSKRRARLVRLLGATLSDDAAGEIEREILRLDARARTLHTEIEDVQNSAAQDAYHVAARDQLVEQAHAYSAILRDLPVDIPNEVKREILEDMHAKVWVSPTGNISIELSGNIRLPCQLP